MMKNSFCFALAISSVLSLAAQQTKPGDTFSKKQTVYLKLGGGFSTRLARLDEGIQQLSPNFQKHIKGMRNGINLQLEAGVFLNKTGNDAIAFQLYNLPINRESKFTEGDLGYTLVNEDRIRFIGINWVSFHRLSKADKIRLISRLGTGTISYKASSRFLIVRTIGQDTFTEVGVSDPISASGFGLTSGIGLDIRISPNLAFETNVDLFTGRVEIIDNVRENLSNLAFSVGLRLSL